MACNCKNKVNPKYADGGKLAVMPDPTNTLERIGVFLFQIVFGIIAFAIVIVAVIPFMVYLLWCLMLGKEARMTLFNPMKWNKRLRSRMKTE